LAFFCAAVVACGPPTTESSIEIQNACYREQFIEYAKRNKIPYAVDGTRLAGTGEDKTRFGKAAQEFMAYMHIQQIFGEGCWTAVPKKS